MERRSGKSGGMKGRVMKSFLQNKSQYLHLFLCVHVLVVAHVSATHSFLSAHVLEKLFGLQHCNKGVSCCLYPDSGDEVVSPWWSHSSMCYITNPMEQQKENVGIMHRFIYTCMCICVCISHSQFLHQNCRSPLGKGGKGMSSVFQNEGFRQLSHNWCTITSDRFISRSCFVTFCVYRANLD